MLHVHTELSRATTSAYIGNLVLRVRVRYAAAEIRVIYGILK